DLRKMAKRKPHHPHLSKLPLLFSFFFLLSLMGCAEVQTSSSPTRITPQISKGKKIADLALLDSQGRAVNLYPLLQQSKKTALIFYRGYWCSYSQGQFADLRARLSEFQAQNTQLIGVSVDDPDLVAEFGRNVERQYLIATKQFKEDEKIELPFLLLSDASREAIQKLGIAEEHPRFGLVARPTTILLDKEGTIQWLYIGKSPGDRPTVESMLQILKWWF
ncbi:MAG: peroxiredoxin family protein, partial [candidate division NC10 bacterium]|nr:peroxiredoxin family protein [candidate division NC10 bacterium]